MSSLRPATPMTGTSWLHRMSPVPKLAWLAAGVAIGLFTYDPVPLLAITALGLAAATSAGILVPLCRTLLAFAPLGASILVIQALAPTSCPQGCAPLGTIGPLTVYEEGVARGLSLVARLLAMEVIAFTVLLTTHPADLFAGLVILRVPRSVAFVAALTMQLVPVLERELALVLLAQRARGLRASGAVALGRAVVPVTVAAIERIGQLSISLEARGFGSPEPRTSWRNVAFRPVDRGIALAGLVAGIAGTIAGLAWWGPASGTALVLPSWLAVAIVTAAGVVFVGVLARAVVLVLRT